MNCKEKLEEAKRLYKFSNDDQRHVLEDLFPELKKKEDKDEKIRIAILNYLRKMWANCKDNVCGVHIEDAISWLEKQGEQKLANKIEPKFKVGDTIAEKDFYECGYGTIKDIKDGQYIFTDGSSINIDEQEEWQLSTNVEAKFKVGDWIIGGIHNKPTQITKIEKEGYVTDRGWVGFSFAEDMHLWTLQDAKDGDILVSKYNQPFIYNGNRNFCHVGSYCGLSTSDKFIVSTSKCFWTENVSIRPATKGQHDLLFQKMHEARYEWDAEKKELKKIEQKPTIEPKFKVGDYIDRKDGLGCHAKIIVVGKNVYGCEKLIYSEDESPFFDLMFENQDEFRISPDFQQNHTWSEEDEEMFEKILQQFMTANNECKLHNASFTYDKEISFLKSLKGRVQPKQEWSEEDKERIKNILSVLGVQVCWNGATGKKGNPYQKEIDWLKSLKPQNHWKPTEAQLASLTIACDRNDRVGFDLTQLLQELKKL